MSSISFGVGPTGRRRRRESMALTPLRLRGGSRSSRSSRLPGTGAFGGTLNSGGGRRKAGRGPGATSPRQERPARGRDGGLGSARDTAPQARSAHILWAANPARSWGLGRALVLSATDEPLCVVPSRRAVVLVLKAKAEIVQAN